MKKIKLFVCLVLLLVGCQPQPQTQPQKEETKNTVSCHFIGDLLYEKPYYDWIEDDSQDKGYYDLVRPYLQNDDLSIANLETPIGGKELNISGTGYSFNASREIGKQVASLDLEVVSTANNHANDRGNQGIDNTLDFLKEKDILAVGTYYNQDDRDQGKYMTIHGIKLGFVSYTYATNQIVSDENQAKVALFNRPSDRKMTQAYKDLLTKEVTQTRENCDVLIAMMHWGNEFTYDISTQQEEVSQLLSDLGVDIIIGNHPHVAEPMEKRSVTLEDGTVKDCFVIYALGNFTADQNYANTRSSVILNLDLTFEDDVLNINSATYTPIYIYENPNVRYHKFKLIDMEDAISKYESSKDTSIGQSLYNTLKFELNNITKIVGDEIY